MKKKHGQIQYSLACPPDSVYFFYICCFLPNISKPHVPTLHTNPLRLDPDTSNDRMKCGAVISGHSCDFWLVAQTTNPWHTLSNSWRQVLISLFNFWIRIILKEKNVNNWISVSKDLTSYKVQIWDNKTIRGVCGMLNIHEVFVQS